jgi:MarR family transcriptional regulator, organic hydroperoxide resistance regulator
MTNATQFSQSLRAWMDTFVHRSMHDSARFIKASGFSMPQFFLLMHLHRHEQCGISDLSEHMDVTAAATSQLVDKLVQAGLLVRMEDPNDRRAKQVSLSPTGEALVEKGIAERSRWVDELAEMLNDEECRKVAEALNILTEKSKSRDQGKR